VYALGEGRYRVRLYYRDPMTGNKRECDRVIQANSVEAAADQRRALARRLETGDANSFEPLKTVGELATQWLEAITNRRRSDGTRYLTPLTQRRYTHTVLEFIVPFLGGIDAPTISARDVEAWRDHLIDSAYRASTVNGHLRVLRQILATIDNPAAQAVRALPEDDARTTEDEPNLLHEEELIRFLQTAKDGWPQHYPLILVLFSTAMRIGTALALRFEDLQPEEGIIRVRRRVSGHEVLPGVKRSRRSADRTPLWPETIEAIEAHRLGFNEAQRASGLLFPNRQGGLRSRSHLNKPFQDILACAGIDKRLTTSSGPRRTASRLYRKVSDSAVAQAVAGHLTEQMHRHYGRVDDEEKRQAARRLRARLRLISEETA